MEGHETLRGRMKFEGRLLKKHANFAKKQQKIDANLREEKKQAKNALNNLIGGRLGLHLGGFGGSFGKGLEALGAFWVVLEALFFMLVCGVVFKSALGAVWLGFWFDFNGFWEDFGRVLERFWEGLGRMCEHSG